MLATPKNRHGELANLEQIDLADNVKLIVKDNVLAVFCDSALKTVSSAIYNGGVQSG